MGSKWCKNALKIFFHLGGGVLETDSGLPKKILKIISIIGVGGEVNPMMENSIMFLLFFLTLP